MLTLNILTTSRGLVSVFQVGIGFSVYWLVFFHIGSVSVVGISKYCDTILVFLVFLCVKAPRADAKILLPNQFANFD